MSTDEFYYPSTPDTETRANKELAVEYRSTKGGRTIGGYAAVYGKRSQVFNGIQEIVEKSAFRKTLGDQANVLCRFEHDPRAHLGSTRAGTLRLADTPVGLDYECDVPVSREDVLELAQRGELRSSFAFLAYSDDIVFHGQQAVRHLISVKLIDCAPTTNPVYSDTDCALRSFARKFDAPIEDVREYASRNELYRFSDQSNRSYIDLGSTPAPLDVAQRSTPTPLEVSQGMTHGISASEARAQLNGMERKPVTNKQRALELEHMKILWDAPTLTTAEARAKLTDVRSWRQYDPRG